jgi:hypothetical protein
MSIDRRRILSGAALAALATPLAARAQTAASAPPSITPAPPAKPTLDDRYAEAARANRQRLAYDGKTFSGPGWDLLLAESRSAQFTMLGEDHFMAEIPALAGQLYGELRKVGYDRISVEISPPAADMLDTAMRDGGLDGWKRWIAAHRGGVAFYNLNAEAEFLAAARALTPGRGPVIWGTDYEVIADAALIAPQARAAVHALQDASTRAVAEVAATKNPMAMFSFGGDAALVRAVRAAWPRPGEEAAVILDTLEQTLIINEHYRTERYYLSNQTRADFQRANFLRHWRAERARGRKPKVMLKYGAGHMVRGLSMTHNFDLGALVSELAVIEGGHAFRVLVLGGPGARQGVMNPVEMTTTPSPVETFDEMGLTPVAGQHFTDGFTVFDLRPLRLLPMSKADPRLVRAVNGFDAMVILPGATPSVFL